MPPTGGSHGDIEYVASSVHRPGSIEVPGERQALS
jgi:hypothetical protein